MGGKEEGVGNTESKTAIMLSYLLTTDYSGSSNSDVPPELFCAACNKLFKSDKA